MVEQAFTKPDQSDPHTEEKGADLVPRARSELIEWGRSLSYKMHLTKGARFQAARRHKKRSIASTWAVTALSMYVFSATSYLAVYDVSQKPELENLLLLMTIVMSAFIIAFSILEQGKKHDLKAELFLKCAQEIGELRDKIEFDILVHDLDEMEARNYLEQYNEIVNDFSENHSETDYRTFRINIGKHEGQPVYSLRQQFRYWLDSWVLMLIAIIAPPIVLISLLLLISNDTMIF